MELYRWFWTLLMIAALAWYSSITVYIAYQGFIDIQQMLRKLSAGTFHSGSPQD